MKTATHTEIAKNIYEEYKYQIDKSQKTLKNMFVLGAEAVLIKCSGKRTIYNNPTAREFCCDINCNNDATWNIRFSNNLEDYTQSCDCHLLSSIGHSVEVTLTKIINPL